MLIKYKDRSRSIFFRLISLIIIFQLLLNDISFALPDYSIDARQAGLSPAPGSLNPAARRESELLSYVVSGRLKFAKTQEDRDFLSKFNRGAGALLLSHGKILASDRLQSDPLKLYRTIIHEQIEAIMQIIAAEDRAKYSSLINMVLGAKSDNPIDPLFGIELFNAFYALFPESAAQEIDQDLLANHIVATAFEFLIIRDNNLINPNELTANERRFLSIIEPVIHHNRHNYFTGVFWDARLREMKIRLAMANGMRFYQVANQSGGVDNPGTVPELIPDPSLGGQVPRGQVMRLPPTEKREVRRFNTDIRNLAVEINEALGGTEFKRIEYKPIVTIAPKRYIVEADASQDMGIGRLARVMRIGPVVLVILNMDVVPDDPQELSRATSELKTEIANNISDKGNSLYEKYSGNVLFATPAYYAEHESGVPLNKFARQMMAAVLSCAQKFKGEVVLDAGAGDGLMSRLALRMGAEKVVMIENDEKVLARARILMDQDGWIEGKHYIILEKDICDNDLKKMVIDYKPSIAMASIGPFYFKEISEDIELAINDKALELITSAPDMKLVINGGHMAYFDKEELRRREDPYWKEYQIRERAGALLSAKIGGVRKFRYDNVNVFIADREYKPKETALSPEARRKIAIEKLPKDMRQVVHVHDSIKSSITAIESALKYVEEMRNVLESDGGQLRLMIDAWHKAQIKNLADRCIRALGKRIGTKGEEEILKAKDLLEDLKDDSLTAVAAIKKRGEIVRLLNERLAYLSNQQRRRRPWVEKIETVINEIMRQGMGDSGVMLNGAMPVILFLSYPVICAATILTFVILRMVYKIGKLYWAKKRLVAVRNGGDQSENDRYLYNGGADVPWESLSIKIDSRVRVILSPGSLSPRILWKRSITGKGYIFDIPVWLRAYFLFEAIGGRVKKFAKLIKSNPNLLLYGIALTSILSARHDCGPVSLYAVIGMCAKQVGRREPCPCGSGKRYKNCCEKKGSKKVGQKKTATRKTDGEPRSGLSRKVYALIFLGILASSSAGYYVYRYYNSARINSEISNEWLPQLSLHEIMQSPQSDEITRYAEDIKISRLSIRDWITSILARTTASTIMIGDSHSSHASKELLCEEIIPALADHNFSVLITEYLPSEAQPLINRFNDTGALHRVLQDYLIYSAKARGMPPKTLLEIVYMTYTKGIRIYGASVPLREGLAVGNSEAGRLHLAARQREILINTFKKVRSQSPHARIAMWTGSVHNDLVANEVRPALGEESLAVDLFDPGRFIPVNHVAGASKAEIETTGIGRFSYMGSRLIGAARSLGIEDSAWVAKPADRWSADWVVFLGNKRTAHPAVGRFNPSSLYGRSRNAVFGYMPVLEEAARTAALWLNRYTGGVVFHLFNLVFVIAHYFKFRKEAQAKYTKWYKKSHGGNAPPVWRVFTRTLFVTTALPVLTTLVSILVSQYTADFATFFVVNTVLHSLINTLSIGEDNLVAPASAGSDDDSGASQDRAFTISAGELIARLAEAKGKTGDTRYSEEIELCIAELDRVGLFRLIDKKHQDDIISAYMSIQDYAWTDTLTSILNLTDLLSRESFLKLFEEKLLSPNQQESLFIAIKGIPSNNEDSASHAYSSLARLVSNDKFIALLKNNVLTQRQLDLLFASIRDMPSLTGLCCSDAFASLSILLEDGNLISILEEERISLSQQDALFTAIRDIPRYAKSYASDAFYNLTRVFRGGELIGMMRESYLTPVQLDLLFEAIGSVPSSTKNFSHETFYALARLISDQTALDGVRDGFFEERHQDLVFAAVNESIRHNSYSAAEAISSLNNLLHTLRIAARNERLSTQQKDLIFNAIRDIPAYSGISADSAFNSLSELLSDDVFLKMISEGRIDDGFAKKIIDDCFKRMPRELLKKQIEAYYSVPLEFEITTRYFKLGVVAAIFPEVIDDVISRLKENKKTLDIVTHPVYVGILTMASLGSKGRAYKTKVSLTADIPRFSTEDMPHGPTPLSDIFGNETLSEFGRSLQGANGKTLKFMRKTEKPTDFFFEPLCYERLRSANTSGVYSGTIPEPMENSISGGSIIKIDGKDLEGKLSADTLSKLYKTDDGCYLCFGYQADPEYFDYQKNLNHEGAINLLNNLAVLTNEFGVAHMELISLFHDVDQGRRYQLSHMPLGTIDDVSGHCMFSNLRGGGSIADFFLGHLKRIPDEGLNSVELSNIIRDQLFQWTLFVADRYQRQGKSAVELQKTIEEGVKVYLNALLGEDIDLGLEEEACKFYSNLIMEKFNNKQGDENKDLGTDNGALSCHAMIDMFEYIALRAANHMRKDGPQLPNDETERRIAEFRDEIEDLPYQREMGTCVDKLHEGGVFKKITPEQVEALLAVIREVPSHADFFTVASYNFLTKLFTNGAFLDALEDGIIGSEGQDIIFADLVDIPSSVRLQTPETFSFLDRLLNDKTFLSALKEGLVSDERLADIMNTAKKIPSHAGVFTSEAFSALEGLLTDTVFLKMVQDGKLDHGFRLRVLDGCFNGRIREDLRWNIEHVESKFLNRTMAELFFRLGAVAAFFPDLRSEALNRLKPQGRRPDILSHPVFVGLVTMASLGKERTFMPDMNFTADIPKLTADDMPETFTPLNDIYKGSPVRQAGRSLFSEGEETLKFMYKDEDLTQFFFEPLCYEMLRRANSAGAYSGVIPKPVKDSVSGGYIIKISAEEVEGKISADTLSELYRTSDGGYICFRYRAQAGYFGYQEDPDMDTAIGLLKNLAILFKEYGVAHTELIKLFHSLDKTRPYRLNAMPLGTIYNISKWCEYPNFRNNSTIADLSLSHLKNIPTDGLGVMEFADIIRHQLFQWMLFVAERYEKRGKGAEEFQKTIEEGIAVYTQVLLGGNIDLELDARDYAYYSSIIMRSFKYKRGPNNSNLGEINGALSCHAMIDLIEYIALKAAVHLQNKGAGSKLASEVSLPVSTGAGLREEMETSLEPRYLNGADSVGLASSATTDNVWEYVEGLGRNIMVNIVTGRIKYGEADASIMPTCDLWAVRHGQTEANLSHMFQGALDEAINQLNETGIRQAKSAAEKLFVELEEKIRSGEEIVILTSQLGRSKDTALAFVDIVKRNTGVTIHPIEDTLLNEISFGGWENKTRETMGPENYALIDRYRVGLDATLLAGDGESFIELLKRARELLRSINDQYSNKTVVLFGHGTQLSALRALLADNTLLDDTGQIDWRNNMLANATPTHIFNVSPQDLTPISGIDEVERFLIEQVPNEEDRSILEEFLRTGKAMVIASDGSRYLFKIDTPGVDYNGDTFYYRYSNISVQEMVGDRPVLPVGYCIFSMYGNEGFCDRDPLFRNDQDAIFVNSPYKEQYKGIGSALVLFALYYSAFSGLDYFRVTDISSSEYLKRLGFGEDDMFYFNSSPRPFVDAGIPLIEIIRDEDESTVPESASEVSPADPGDTLKANFGTGLRQETKTSLEVPGMAESTGGSSTRTVPSGPDPMGVVDVNKITAEYVIRRTDLGDVVDVKGIIESGQGTQQSIIRELSELRRQIWYPEITTRDWVDDSDDEDKWKKDLENINLKIFVFIDNGIIDGYSIFTVEPDKSEILSLGARRNRWRHGIGSLLMKSWLSYLKDIGAKEARWESNGAADDFYGDFLKTIGLAHRSYSMNGYIIDLDSFNADRRIDISMTDTILSEENDFIKSMKDIDKGVYNEYLNVWSEKIQPQFGTMANRLESKIAKDPENAQSLILYADDMLEDAMVIDIENTVRNVLSKYNVLGDGKIIIYARNAANAEVIERMIKLADNRIEVVRIMHSDVDVRTDEMEEEAVLRCARRTHKVGVNGNEILAIIRGRTTQPEDLAAFASKSKIPVVICVEKGVYSFAQAIAMAIEAKVSNGKKRKWLIELPVIMALSDRIREKYEEYKRSLAALVAA